MRVPAVLQLAVMCAVLLASAPAALAVPDPQAATPLFTRAPSPGADRGDLPASRPPGFGRADTLNWGDCQIIGANQYAVLGGIWDWEPPFGACGPTEGWYSVDETANLAAYFRQITAASWGGHGNTVAAPIISGSGTAWLGAYQDQADSLCWDGGLGYGNNWCQRLTGPLMTYGGTGEVSLNMTYFNNSEAGFDYTRVLVVVGTARTSLNGPGFNGVIGTPPAGPWANYARTISQGELGGPGERSFRVSFEFTADGGWSDQDGQYATSYGPFAADDVNLGGDIVEGAQSFDFESGLQGWTAERCPGIGSFFAIHPVSDYVIQDPCQCRLAGNVAALHNANDQHPVGQLEAIYSPPVDHTNYMTYNNIFADWDQYSELPLANGVFYRPGFRWYPSICQNTGQPMWGRMMESTTFYYDGDSPICYQTRHSATNWGVPASCSYVGFIYELYSSCDAFGIPPTQCTGVTNATPLIDNVRIRMTSVPNAPVAAFEIGGLFSDGFAQGEFNLPQDPGNADIVRNLHMATPGAPDRLGDSLVVNGPTVTASTRWEARLWFRVPREGPFQVYNANYRAWKERVRKGLQIAGWPHAQFTYGWMDSVESPSGIYKSKFCSRFREGDPSYSPPEMSENNEIIPDGILTPGTKIEYFVTTNYTCTPNVLYYLPDTSGGYFEAFEILPSWRNVPNGYYKFPCVLFVDASQGVAKRYVECALNQVLNGATQDSAAIPSPTTWDRYDYQDAQSSWHAPLFRNPGGNAGATLFQLLEYRIILLNSGNDAVGSMDQRDWQGFDQWLTTTACNGNGVLQGWWGGGEALSQMIKDSYPAFLYTLGAVSACDAYSYPGCPPGDTGHNDDQYCVRIDPAASGPWQPAEAIDIYGNWCPTDFRFDVLDVAGTGVGNKVYQKIGDTYAAQYAQVVNDRIGPQANFRSVLDGYSLHHLTRSSGTGNPNPGTGTDCPNTFSSIIAAANMELTSAIKWMLNIPDPRSLSDLSWGFECITPPGDVHGGADLSEVNRLYPNAPNPFNPRTTIRFSLAQAGTARLMVYDVNGRKVRTMADGPFTAGPHTLVWDGTDDLGHRVPAGVFWTRLSAGEFRSNLKMVVLK